MVIMGTGVEAEEVIYKCMKYNIAVDFLLDNYQTGEIHKFKIFHPDEIQNLNEFFVIVAVKTEETYLCIKESLVNKGLTEFHNFIWSKMWNKKIVVINANCHGTALKKYLNTSKEFNTRYAIYPMEEIQFNTYIDDNLLKHADVFIHQDIRKNNKIAYSLSDEYIIPKLKEKCQKICIPNFVGLGKMMHQTLIPEKGYATKNQVLMFYRDSQIDQCIETTEIKTIDQLRKIINEFQIMLDVKEVVDTFNQGLKKLKDREAKWDINISLFLVENYKNKKMFNDLDHPSNELMKYICDQIANILDIKTVNFSDFELGVESFVSPGIKEILGMNFMEEKVESMSRFTADEKYIGVDDYLRQYVWIHYEIVI